MKKKLAPPNQCTEMLRVGWKDEEKKRMRRNE
jgi:hypothetical protein